MNEFLLLEEKLASLVSPERFQHSRWVAKTSRELAVLYRVDEGKAELAGLLHDCAKDLSDEEMKKHWDEAVVFMSDDERMCEGVWHAYVGHIVAKGRFGVNDAEVLTAIRRHSVGEAGMGDLDAIIYVADACSPRELEYQAQRDVLLEIARRDLWKGVLAVVTFKLGLGEEKGTVPLRKGVQLKEWVQNRIANHK